MKLDCYAVLGLSPTAEDAVIRAAYLALMRRYHPDRDGSAEAAARARAITDAYRTIGNATRRAEYDASVRAHHYDILGYEEEPERRSFRMGPIIPWPKASVLATIAGSALAIVLAVTVLPMIDGERGDMTPRQTSVPPDAAKAVATEGPGASMVLPTAQKQPPALDASSAVSRPTEPNSPEAPAIRTLPERALAARPKSAPAIENKSPPAKIEVSPKPKRIAASPPPAAARPVPPKATAPDQKARVAALESWSTSFYNQSVSNADEARRSQLQLARDLFVRSRNACRSDSCVGDAHASYISQISRIMTKPN